IMGSPKPIVTSADRCRPTKSEVYTLIASNVKASHLLNWQPQYSLTDGLRETVEFIKSHMHLFKPEQYTL
ncbi:MAG: hypothetical protein LLF89_11205, partial [Spirochaetaceae bacterium]|nr:hypothetical protein [Spirochaetaceae bacterium]